ncbi:MAG: NUDIX hydrolase [bacterium]|nr:NUDIX hydrolase [bacterium]
MKNKSNKGKIGVSQKAIIVRKDGKFLAIRRSKTDPRRPLQWDLPGGELEFGEDAQKDILREIKEETGLRVRDLQLLDVISGFDDQKDFWVTICYFVETIINKPVLSYEHDQWRWVNPNEFQLLKASKRNKKFVAGFKLFKLKQFPK